MRKGPYGKRSSRKIRSHSSRKQEPDPEIGDKI